MTDPFEQRIKKKDPKKRVEHMSDEEYKKYCVFRSLLWDAIDKKKEISIIETAKQLGMKGKAYSLERK